MEIDWSKAPEGATHWGPESGGWVEAFYKKDQKGTWLISTGDYKNFRWHGDASDHHDWPERLASLEQRRSPWTGEGLPPVGTVCEYYADDGVWRSCEIVAHKDGQAVVWVSNAHIWASSGASLRPIRAPEQIASEEALEEIERLYSEGGPAAVFDAGYRKQA